jgi:peptidyl-prolyl cis-trans isomerase B (cyclophilin B)
LKQFDSADFIKVLARSALHQYHFVSNDQNSTEKQMMKKHMIAFGRLPVFAFVIFALTSGALLAQDNPSAVIRTSMGEIQVELYADKAPLSVENFINYANSGFYNGTIFHRVIGHFMIQGGGFTPDMQKKATGEPIQNEAANGLQNKRGTLAMARTNDPHSATSQFFINVQDNANLNYAGEGNSREWGYAVFGRVTSGMSVVDSIRFVATGTTDRYSDVPVEPVVIESVEIITP